MKNMFSKGAHPSEFGHRQTTMLMLGLFLLVSQCLFAQSRIIKGTVYDEHKDALIGASVILKGTSQGTITDIDGNFSVEASDKNTVLIVSYIGYDAQEINVGSQTFVKVQLKPSSLALEEVVVVGYGSQKKSELTAAISSVKSSDFVRGNVRDAGQLLKGKIAGLSIVNSTGDPTENSSILLRGTNSLQGNNSPLVLIDGIPGDLRTVAPEDIAQIDVLKDGSSAAIYGTRATNGVILVTTRKANSDFSIDYNGYVGTEEFVKTERVLTGDEFRSLIQDGTISATDFGGNTDWLEAITRTPVNHGHNLSVKGGSEKTNYLLNVNYKKNQGIFKKSDNEALIVRLAVNHSMLNDKLRLNVSVNSNTQNYTTTGDGSSFNRGVYSAALVTNPTLPIYKQDVNKDVLSSMPEYDGPWAQPSALVAIANPLSTIETANGRHHRQRTRLNGNVTFQPIESLKFNALLSWDRYYETRGYRETFDNFNTTVAHSRDGFASRGTCETTDQLFEFTAQYSEVFGIHNISVLGGYGYQKNIWEDYWMRNWNFPTDQFGWDNIALGRGDSDIAGAAIPINSNKTSGNLISFFGRINYILAGKYLATISVRHEADSKFVGSDQVWGTFPAVSLAWRINEENFMKNIKWINSLKLRAGYGVTGIAPSNPYLATYRLGYTSNNDTFYYNGQWVNKLTPQSNPNPEFTWEKKKEFNVGLDFSILKDRISGSVDAYYRKTVDLLYNYPVPVPPNVYGTTLANVGTISNKGLEILLNGVVFNKKDFGWNTTLTYSTNKNKLDKLNNSKYQLANDYFYVGDAQAPMSGVPTHRVKVGEPIGQIWVWKVLDITEDGKWIYEDQNGNAVESKDVKIEDRKVIGNGLPKHYLGWNNDFRYKNFDLSVTMRGAFGFQNINFTRLHYENYRDQAMNNLKAGYEKVFGKAVLTDSKQFNSYYVEDGDYWKIDNIVLGYNFKKDFIKGIKGMRLYFSVQNALTITGYKGLDPEVGGSLLTPGTDDRNKYPTTRSYTFGVNLNF